MIINQFILYEFPQIYLLEFVFTPFFECSVFQIEDIVRYFVVNASEPVDQKIFSLFESARINEICVWISIIEILIEKQIDPVMVWDFSIVYLIKGLKRV